MKIGLIGGGDVVESLHLPVLSRLNAVSVEWVCDTSAARSALLARNWGIPRSFSNLDECSHVDAVLIATPVGTREAILEKTFARRWHALCEKPFAPSVDAHKSMLSGAAAAGLTVAAGYMRRYFWGVQRARKILGAQTLGRLVSVTASEAANLDRTGVDLSSYRNDKRASGGGVLLETGCHLIDQLLFVADAATVRIERCEQQMSSGYQVETSASGTLSCEGAGEVALEVRLSGVRPVFQGIVFRCERGELLLHLDPAKGLEISLGDAPSNSLAMPHPRPTSHLDLILQAFRDEWLNFIDGVQGARSWNAPHETGLLTTEAMEQCIEAATPAATEVQECVL